MKYLILLLMLFVINITFTQDIEFDPTEIQMTDVNAEVYTIKFDSDGGLIFEADNSTGRNLLKLFDDQVQKISIGYDPAENLNIINRQTYDHPSFGANQVFGDGEAPFIIASAEGTTDGSGIHGDGDAITLWAPGDGAAGSGLFGYLFIVDEDRWNDDTNPYDGTALIAYLNTSGVWTVSDRNRKTNIKKYQKALSKVNKMNAYSYEYKVTDEELKKGEVPMKAIGLMAQEIEKIVPQAVNVSSSGEYFVNYNMVTPVLVEAIKEQQELISRLEARISALEKK